MFKRISCLMLSLCLFVGVLMQQAAAAEETGAFNPDGSFLHIYVDKELVETTSAYLFEDIAYVPLRSVTQALRPDAVVTWENDHAVVTADGLSLTAYPGACYIQANGRYLYIPTLVQFVDDKVMVPVRVLAKALDAQVWWDCNDEGVYITSGSGAIVPGDQFYNATSLSLLSHIIYSESGNQPLNGKIAVGNVILNRVKSPSFPNTIYDVVYQKGQFAPSVAMSREPNAESVLAAKLCLDGAVVLPTALFFNQTGCTSWASRNKTYVATIAGHDFYN